MKKIYVIDDETDLLLSIKLVIEFYKKDYKVIMIETGKKLFELLKKEKPDLIILDIMIPDMNGWEIFNKLKTNPFYDKIPIIFISAVFDDTSKITANELGDDFIEKPFDAKMLLNKIEKII